MNSAFLLLVTPFLIAANGLIPETQAAEPEHKIHAAKVDVTEQRISDTKPVKGYQAKRSSTATKTDTPLIDVPQSISVITQDQINDQSIHSMADAIRYTPGLVTSQGEGNRDAINFRGAGVTTGDFYLDGIRDDIQTYRDFYNTDRIEVLKGPNGMIFGRGAAGGAINRVSKEAGWDPVREIKLSYGAYNQKRTSIDIGNAINDVAAFRLNAVYEESDSYRSGVNLKRYGANPTFTITPSDQTKITIGAEYFKDQHIGDRGIPSFSSNGGTLNNRPFRLSDNNSIFFGNANLSPNETKTSALNALIEHNFDHDLILRNRSRYAYYDKFYQNVYANSAVGSNGNLDIGAYYDATARTNLINQTDLLFTLATGEIKHQFVLGMELGSQDTSNYRIRQGNSDRVGTISAANPLFLSPISFNTLSRDRKSTADIFAIYMQDQIKLSENWEAILGLRHDQFAAKHQDIISNSKFEVTDRFFSPRAGLIYKPVSNVSLYASYSLSFVPRAGDQLTNLNLVQSALTPEKFINQEIGAKWDVLSDLSLTLAAYKLERQNVEIVISPTKSLIADGQETKGLELGFSGKVNHQISVFGGYSFQDAKITKDLIGSTAILAGTRAGQTPEHTFSAWTRYDFNDTWGAALGIVSRSSMYALTPTTTESTILAGYTRYDAAVFWKPQKNLQLQLNVENLTDKDYVLSAHNNNNLMPGAPISARLSAIYQF